MILLFAITLFLSSALLFLVEPMFAKMVLPLLGGTPSVWNTCLVFFQTSLFLGYLYADASASWLTARRQVIVHVTLLVLPLAMLPLAVDSTWTPSAGTSPVLWLLGMLAVTVGLPFVAVSTSAPVLQHWFASTDHAAAGDPYFLYQASNLGSIGALLAYPALLEPSLRLSRQSQIWSMGYGLFVVLTIACAVVSLRSIRSSGRGLGAQPVRPRPAPLAWSRQLRWLVLALVPSSLMMGVTTYLSTDIAAIPLLWVVPLLIYLLTFVLAFGRRQFVSRGLTVRLLPFVLLPLMLPMIFGFSRPAWMLISLHLLTFAIAAMICHGELACDRPGSEHLTRFYLWVSLGGALGGIFNALVAPLVFSGVVEYPLAIVLACLLRPPVKIASNGRRLVAADIWLPCTVGLVALALIVGVRTVGLESDVPIVLLTFGVPAAVCFSFRNRPVRFGLAIATVLMASIAQPSVFGPAQHAERNFFGVLRIRVDREHHLRTLFHGSTMHGRQSLEAGREQEPLSYFTRSGPIGQVFASYAGRQAPTNIGVIGLGSGTLASYGQRGQHWTFYEIDPAVERIARDPRYFTFLRDSPAQVDVVLGDARLSLARAPDVRYGLFILDAFSSDAIPVHLVTREALKLYLSRLAPGGLLAFHISNRHLGLRPVFSDLAEDAGLIELSQLDVTLTEAEAKAGKSPSSWVLMARDRRDLAALAGTHRWSEPAPRSAERVWTDDYSDLLSVFQWR